MMTDDIAYVLGKFDMKHFYGDALWAVNLEPFEYHHFFTWSMGNKVMRDSEGRGDYFNLVGTLNTNLFTNVSHKLNYIRGRVSSHSVVWNDGQLTVYWANSYNLRDFFVKCLEDVLRAEGVVYTIEVSEGIIGSCPGTPGMTLECDSEVISRFFKHSSLLT